MKKITVFILALIAVLSLMTVAWGDEITVTHDGNKTDYQNGAALSAAIKEAPNGSTINVSAGIFAFTDGNSRFDFNNKSVTIVGSGEGKTIIQSDKYGVVLQDNHNPSGSTTAFTLKNMTIKSTYHCVYAKYNITVNLENLDLETKSTAAILLDSSNAYSDGMFYNGNTVVNATGVRIQEGKTVEMNALPCTGYADTNKYPGAVGVVSRATVNIGTGCNFDVTKCKPQNCSLGVDNLFVDDNCINHIVAKVGDTNFFNINDAIAAWTNGRTLTLLDDVTLNDVITLSSQEHHFLNLGTYTLIAADGKDAIEIKSVGRSNRSESGALTIAADTTDPGGINAGNKACVTYKYDSTLANDQYDRPIIYIKGGVFTGSGGISCNGHSSAQDKCATFNISGGTFNCDVSLVRAKLLISGGTFNGELSCTGGSTAFRGISGGKFKSFGEMTADKAEQFYIGSGKSNYNVGAYIDDEGYLVVGGSVITDPGTNYEASTNYDTWNSALQYSSVASTGLYWTDIDDVMSKKPDGEITPHVNLLDLTNTSFNGTLLLPDANSQLTVTFAEGAAPAWNVGTECEGKIAVYTDAISSGVVTRTYTLKDVYKVTLNPNGGTIADGKNVTSYTYGTSVTLPVADDMTKTGYTFAGWYANSDFSDTAVTKIAAGSTSDKSYYAKWTANSYTVNLNTNGGTITEGNVETYTYDTGATLPTPTKTGYTFSGWYDNEQFSGDAVTEIPADATGDKEYHAKWTPNTYTVAFKANSGDGTMADMSFTYGTAQNLTTNAFTRVGYNFAGWATSADGAVAYANGASVSNLTAENNGEVTLYAVWTKIPPAPVYPSVDTPAFDPDEDVDVEDNTLNDAALAVGGAIENGDVKMEPAAGYTVEEITKLQNEGKLNLVIQKKLSYDTTEKSLIDAAITKVGGSASQVDVVYIDVTPVLMTDDGTVVATITDTEKPLTITLDLSAEMQKAAKEGKFISVIRVHDGKVTFLDSKLNAEKTKITFTSSEFSTYAVVAMDKDPSANTFDAGIAMYGAMAVLAATGSAVIIKKRKA